MPTTATSMPAPSSRPSSIARACRSSTTAIRRGQDGRHLARHRPDEGRAVRPAQPQRPGRQAADHPVPRDRLLQRPRLCRLARRRHGDPRRQGSHQAEAARDLRLQSAVPRRQSRRRPHLGAGGDAPGRASRPRRAHRRDLRLPARLRAHPRCVRPEESGGGEGRAPGQCGAALDLPLRLRLRQFRSRRRRRSSATATVPAAVPARPRICRGSTSARRASSTSPGTTRACARWTSPIRSRRSSSGTTCRRAPARPAATTATPARSSRIPTPGLLYLTDGNGAGLMVLRYTGPIPDKHPIPGGR